MWEFSKVLSDSTRNHRFCTHKNVYFQTIKDLGGKLAYKDSMLLSEESP